MAKIKALITLVVGKGKEIRPGNEYELTESEATRLVSLGFAELVTPSKTQSNDKQSSQKQGGDNDTSTSESSK